MDLSKRFKDQQEIPFKCDVTKEILCNCDADIVTSFHRVAKRSVEPCLFGKKGTCCKHCNMGPCQIIEGIEEMRGVCGVDAATVAARNFARIVAAGSAAHIDHARGIALAFLAASKGENDYQIRDITKLKQTAIRYGIDITGKDPKDIAIELGEKVVKEFGQQEGEIALANRAPEPRKELWRKLRLWPRGIDREVVELMHRTHMGVDQDYENIIDGAARCALADGWGASMIATELTDIMFGTPVPIRTKISIGVLKRDEINVTVHGHEPIVAEALAIAANDPEILAEAKKVGAKGINLAGVCCTGNEILMRRGLPIAGSFIQQEAVIATGAIEAMVVDVQCVIQGVIDVAKHFHTAIITTTEKAMIRGAVHIPFDEHHAIESAKRILREAISRFPKRGKTNIPVYQTDVIAGFSHETINYILGGRFRDSYKPLNENIINGRIRGVAAFAGCDNFRLNDKFHPEIARELIANDILVVATGCAASVLGRAGLMSPDAISIAGSGLREVLEAVGCPPVLHMGACVDNSRILIALTEMVKTGGLGNDIIYLPAIGCAAEWMSEKAIAIGHYFVASGARVVFGPNLPVEGSKVVFDYLTKGLLEKYGAVWHVARTPSEFASTMIDAINYKRKCLGIDKKRERVLFDMAMRRQLGAIHGVGCHGPGQ